MYLESKKSKRNPLDYIIKPYELYSIYNIVVVVLCLILLLAGVLSSTSNPMPNNSLFFSNILRGQSYYFPGHLSVASASQRGLSIFNIPVLTGLSHEPHVLLLLIGPSFFFFLSKIKRFSLKVLSYILLFCMLIISTSATAIMAFGIVFFIEQIYNLFIGKHKMANYILLILLSGFLAWFISAGADIVDSMSEMMANKLGAGNDESSKGFSISMLRYMITPNSLLGRGNLPLGTGFELDNQDIGYVSCVLDLLFFFLFLLKTISYAFSKNTAIHYCGLAMLYFFIHNLKMGVQSFSFYYISFFVILTVILDNRIAQMKKTFHSEHIQNENSKTSKIL